jgi:hypothetical protein
VRRVLLCLCAAAPLAAQGPTDAVGSAARTGFVFDGYYFGSGYAFDHVVEWTVPVTLSHRFGPRLTVDLSAGYARASAATTSGTLEVSGATDTDVRVSWGAVSGHLIVSLAGTLPTGKKAVDTSSVPLLSALATEVLNFTTANFGTGGGVTGGFATAFKLGERWAAGAGGSYRWSAPYTPVVGGSDLEPGGEGRVRLGVEGPLRGGAYFRGAAVYATSGADTLSAGSRSVSGARVLIYSGLSLPAGRSSVSLYAYDRYRLRPSGYDSTFVQVPRGNVLALGARLERSLSPALTLAPNIEFRHELAGPPTGRLELLGWLVRPGMDLRYRAGGAVTVLVQGQTAFGRLATSGASESSVSLVGPRAVVLLEWAR